MSEQPDLPEETALYYIYGVADLLLYIGISNDFGKRWKQHARKQPWWGEKRWMTTLWYDSRPEAEAAETAAIEAERPKYNKVHAARSPEPEYLVEPGVPAPADLPGWLTVAEAARRYGCSDMAIYQAHRRGVLEGQRFWRTSLLVSENDLELWIADRPKRKAAPLPFGVTARQAEVLLDVYLKRGDNPEYGMLIVTRRSLRRRGLVAEGGGLTAEGEKVARELHRQQGAEVTAA